jgi:DNA replication ATP-dependent helicase Dna2
MASPTQREIVEGIRRELDVTGRERRFEVVRSSRQQNAIRLDLRPSIDGRKLDYTLEGGAASWHHTASPVVAVSVDEFAVYVQPTNDPVPRAGEVVTIRPPRFLDALLECWMDDVIATACFNWAAQALVSHDLSGRGLLPSFGELRERQKAAYRLISYRAGFLWGPPGTGKTRTAGSIVSDFALTYPDSKILLIAPTNVSVDQLLIAVDDRLATSTSGQMLRRDCARIGSNFLARYYSNRPHLLPLSTDDLLREKARLEALQPDAEDFDAVVVWKRQMDRISTAMRAEFVETVAEKRIVAMTAALASMHYKELHALAPFSLGVLDEASQLGRAVSLMLAPLTKQVLIAGDPKQLPPIFSVSQASVAKWFGRTLFDDYMHKHHPSTCFLNEQSRMAKPICTLVSSVFYDGELQVCEESLSDPAWLHERQGISLGTADAKNVHIVDISTEATPYGSSQRRAESAEVAVRIVQQLMRNIKPSSILILTPFVPQKKLIREKLKASGLSSIKVSTVHAAQGSERHTIIFDPVKGDSWFLRKPDVGPRLINVAVSRAQGCLILLLSRGDCEHPILASLYNIATDKGTFHLGT